MDSNLPTTTQEATTPSQSISYSVGAPSLLSIARRKCLKNVDDIQSFGDAPLELIEPIVRKVQDPEQLRMLEEVSPQILPITPAIWKSLISRDIPNGHKNTLEPKNPASWWKVYRKLKKEDDVRKRTAEAQLRAALGQAKAEKDSHKSTILHSVLPGRPDRGVMLKTGVTSRNLGKNALTALRRERNSSAFKAAVSRRSTSVISSTPSKGLGPIRGIVSQAPTNMVQSYARQNGSIAPTATLPRPAIMTPANPFNRAPLKRRPIMRNPFGSKSNSTPAHEQEAFRLATQIEHDTQRAKAIESKKAVARITSVQTKAANSVEPRPQPSAATRPTTSTTSRASTATTNLKKRKAGSDESDSPDNAEMQRGQSSSPPRMKHSRTTSPPTAGSAKAAPAAKRKPVNIFMAPSKRIKR